MNFETKDIRLASQEMFNLKGLDDKLKFYYDETNNIRKYHLKKDKFNESIKTNFVLGGIVLEEGQEVEIEPLFDSFGLQNNVVEVKLKNLAKGNFVKCLDSKHLLSIFEFLLDNDIYIHYSSLNFLYFSIVDIVDSLIEATGIKYNPFYNRALKNDLYIGIKNNINSFTSIFYEYEYPDIKENKVISFIDELIKIFSNEPKNVGNRTLLMLLKKSKVSKNLYFIMNETSHSLIKDFSQFYSRTLYLFLNSKHIFDKEDSIEPLINELNLTYDNSKIDNFTFIDSKGNRFIQLSDILIGLIGKFYNFINENSKEQIKESLKNLNDLQTKTLKSFCKILIESENKNKAYVFITVSNDELEKIKLVNNYA